MIAIYTRTNEAQAWKFERVADAITAKLAAEVNQGFGVFTLGIDVAAFPNCRPLMFLDSAQQEVNTERGVPLPSATS